MKTQSDSGVNAAPPAPRRYGLLLSERVALPDADAEGITGAVIVSSFAVLGYFGGEVYRQAPPIPERIVTDGGRVIYTASDIREGQNVWQSMGGQEVGTVWGHGAYITPDWSADYLHREAVWLLDRWATVERGQKYQDLGVEDRAALKSRLKEELRRNIHCITRLVFRSLRGDHD